MLLCYKSDRAITYGFCRDLHLIFMFSGLLQKRSVSRKVKFGEKLFQTKLLSHLSNKVCRLLSSPVLLRKFTNTSKETRLQGGVYPLHNRGAGVTKLYMIFLKPVFGFKSCRIS